MWIPTQSESIEMFARHFETFHRAGAAERARRTAAALAEKGDRDGHAVWIEVADRIEHLRQPQLLARRRALEMA